MSFLYSSHFWIIIGIIVFAIILAFVGAKLLKRGEDQANTQDTPQDSGPSLFDILKAFIGKIGIFPIDDISKSFVRALKVLRTYVGGRNFAYQLPWVLVIGAKNSGKTSFINSLNLDVPISSDDLQDDPFSFSLLNWNFYNHGILIEADGSLVLNEDLPQSDEIDFRLLADSFAKYRTKRPLDGIVLTISYDELAPDSDYDFDDKIIRAEYLYKRLWELQRVTGMRLPIYLVVTKCDKIAGFDTLTSNLENEALNSIFGWSNDKSLDVMYRPEWVDEAFDSVMSGVYQTQESLFTKGLSQKDRDGIFMFPLSLKKLQEGLQIYCDQLFKSSSYHESFFLRGIYFTGSEEAAAAATTSQDDQTSFSIGAAPIDNAAFTTELIDSKIFQEVGLARPVSGRFLGNTKALNIAKVGVAAGAIIGTLGLLKANEKLKVANLNLLPALQQIEIQLEGLSAASNAKSDERLYFDSHAQVLLNTMSQIEINNLFSLFIPSSWFSPVDQKIQKVMSIAYNQIIFQSLYREMNERAKNLVSLSSSQIGVQVTNEASQDPLQSAEFMALQSYATNMATFEQIAELYNSLSNSSSPADVAKIVKYLFDYDLPASFLQADEYYSEALLQSQVKTFDFDLYTNSAVSKLQALFESFEDVAFDVDNAAPHLNRLMTALQKIANGDELGLDEVNALRSLSSDLNFTLNEINNPNLNWIDAVTFDPGEPYDLLMNNIATSRYFFDSNLAGNLASEAEKRFVEFEATLASYTSPLTSGPIFEIESGNIISQSSAGASLFQGNLNIFFSESFMANLTSVKMTSIIPTGSVLLWDATQLQQAINMIDNYNSYLSSQAMTFPKNIQPILNVSARQNLIQNITTILANAQVLDATVGMTATMSPEDALLSQVQNYRITQPLLEQIFYSLKTNQANNTYAQLRSILTNQNYALLTKIDEIMEDDHPYAIKDNSFDWWTGESLAALEAFGVDTLPDLKSYITLQRERISYLAKEFADPIVTILSNVNKDGMPSNLPLINKWNGIIQAIDGYSRKTPNNSLIALEGYIEGTLTSITLASCPQLATNVTPSSYEMDFFTSILQNMQIELANQCHTLASQTSSQSYNQLATFFNSNLAGKFPFVNDPLGVAPDSFPSDIQAFYDLMDQSGATIASSLQEAKSLGTAGAKASEFLQQMTDIRQFFGGFLVAKNPIASPAFTLKVDFRVNRDREVLGNQIIDWNMNVNNSTIDFRNPSAAGFWQYGNPVSINFQWAANSPLEPTSSSDNLAMQVSGSTVSFNYPGNWGLLRLLLTQRAALSDFNNLVDNQPTTLKFQMPVAAKGNVAPNLISNNATVFVRVTVQPIKDATQEQQLITGTATPSQSATQLSPTTSVPLPTFPIKAPVLSSGGPNG